MRVLFQGKGISNGYHSLFSRFNILGVRIPDVEIAGNPSIIYKINIIENLVELPVAFTGNNPWLGRILLPGYNAERKRS